MVIRKLTLIAFVLLGAVFQSAVGKTLFAGYPEFSKLHITVADNALVAGAPVTRVKKLNYVSEDLGRGRQYSDYQINVLRTKKGLSRYSTVEVAPHLARTSSPDVVGNGIGYGGIISLAYLKTGTLPGIPQFYHQFEITKVSNVHGNIFPLKTGNQVKFHYTAWEKKRDGSRPAFVEGEIKYVVTKRLQQFKYAKPEIKGPIYEVQFYRNTQDHPRFFLQNTYLFSQKLGWYIQAIYYHNNQAVATYRLRRWS